MDHDGRRAHAFALDDAVKRRGIAGVEPHAAVRGRAAEVAGIGVAMERIACQLVFRSVGYSAMPIQGLPFDQKLYDAEACVIAVLIIA